MPKLCVFAARLYLCEKLIASESTDGLSMIDHFWSYLPHCHKYVVISVLCFVMKLPTFSVIFGDIITDYYYSTTGRKAMT